MKKHTCLTHSHTCNPQHDLNMDAIAQNTSDFSSNKLCKHLLLINIYCLVRLLQYFWMMGFGAKLIKLQLQLPLVGHFDRMDKHKVDVILQEKKAIEYLKIELARAEGNNDEIDISVLKTRISAKEKVIARLEGGENLDNQLDKHLMPPPPPPPEQ